MTTIDLTAAAGLPIDLDPVTGRLAARAPARLPDEEPRPLGAMADVLREPGAAGPDPLYWMYRDAGVAEQTAAARALGLRFDLTVLRGGRVGRERVKTFGHVHPPALDGTPFPELYQVLSGRGWILLQRGEDETAVWALACGPGDLALIPPGFAHATVNDGDEPLVLANWVASGFRSDYGPVARRRGLAFYRLAEGGWERNPAYGTARLWQAGPAPAEWLGLRPGEPIYAAGVRDPGAISFLVRPGAAAELWAEADRHLAAAQRVC